MNETTAGSRRQLIADNPQVWLCAMLLALHAALAWGIDTLFSRAMLLVWVVPNLFAGQQFDAAVVAMVR
ncbi:MAG: hypothetical protein NTW47_09385, partial [Proteobacteria bacterium]|nr:hypothetical protein [Pseudomonadota bacterium]